MTPKPPPKRDVMLALLQQAESVFVNFDPRREGVLVPPSLKRQPRVVLQYGLNMRIPIPDLDIGEDGIGATLSFDRAPTWTFVPWTAVFAIVSQDHRGMLWEADVPREIESEQKPDASAGPGASSGAKKSPGDNAPAQITSGKKSAGGKSATKKAAGKPRPTLRAVEGGQSEPKVEATPARGALTDARIEARTETRREVAEAKQPEPVSTEPTSTEAPEAATSEPRPARASDEIVELPEREPKKKREIPPYLRIVK